MLVALAVAGATMLSACGATTRSHTTLKRLGTYTVKAASSFPSHQRLSEKSQLVVTVTNMSKATLPDVAVTLTNPDHRQAAGSTGSLLPSSDTDPPLLTDRARPIWTINSAPQACGRDCENLGPGPDTATYSRTWALGQLAPGKTIKFDWRVTAVQPGTFTIHYTVAADVAGGVKTVLPGGAPATGVLAVQIAGPPRRPLKQKKTTSG